MSREHERANEHEGEGMGEGEAKMRYERGGGREAKPLDALPPAAPLPVLAPLCVPSVAAHCAPRPEGSRRCPHRDAHLRKSRLQCEDDMCARQSTRAGSVRFLGLCAHRCTSRRACRPSRSAPGRSSSTRRTECPSRQTNHSMQQGSPRRRRSKFVPQSESSAKMTGSILASATRG